MKEPFWILTYDLFKEWRKVYYKPIWKLIYIWIVMQLSYIKELYFKKCTKNHFWSANLYCLRCKKSKYQLDIERRLKEDFLSIQDKNHLIRIYNKGIKK